MSPEKQVALMVAIFSTLGVGVSVGIIAAGGGFSGGGSIFNPPTQSDIYVIGSQVKDGMSLDYTLTGRGPATALVDSQVSIRFEQEGDGWRASFVVVNGTATEEFEIMFSKQLVKEGGVEEQTGRFLEPIESSIISIRDMDYGGRDKYLVQGAPWSTIYYGSSSTLVRISGEETVETPAGTFDAFVLSYKLEEKTSKIWIVKDLPLPVKAETYDSDDNLDYRFELVRLER